MHTPSNVSFIRRFFAICYDALILFGLLCAATIPILIINHGHAVEPGNLSYRAYLATITCVYFISSWWIAGQTIGMKAWGIQLHSLNNQPASLNQILFRLVGSIFSWSCFGLGYLWILFSKRKLAWHDMLSGTHLVKTTVLNTNPGEQNNR